MKLYIFPTPIDATCTITHDSGWHETGLMDIHPSGRAAQSFEIPDDTPNGNGCQLLISAPKKVALLQRGILFKGLGEWIIQADDFHLMDEKVCPEPTPAPIPIPRNEQPLTTIQRIALSHNLTTKEGCGQFTEACVTELRRVNQGQWQHIPKTGAQNQYNKHAVDAMNLNIGMIIDGQTTKSGIYDIVINSESEMAKPAFNRQGDAITNGYYPA